ncbi:MAG: L-aspartate oxidase [Gammaproteobacteria bacterium]|nr:L-aspartate oxidase [Gammaproteobacteria bacterium]
MHDFDVLIIGSGAAGLSLALRIDPSMQVAVLSKGSLDAGSTAWAQGGISAVIDEGDSIDQHMADTVDAGVGLCDENAVYHTVVHGKEMIAWLTDLGIKFTREKGADGKSYLHLTREGGHTQRRVVHAADATGRAIQNTLIRAVSEKAHIQVFEQHITIDLITTHKLPGAPGAGTKNRCVGAYVLDTGKQRVETFRARHVVLATGGANKVYLYTSNPDGSSGDGIAMAWRAGCRIANMEFMQFHPTCLYHPNAKSYLITESVRGEGGRLLLPDGSEFMHEFDSRGVLAPRDIVARAIDHKMKKLGIDCVYLDISHKPKKFIQQHFPNVYARCMKLGYDMCREPVPVVPAAHYTCGGVMTDLKGRTDVSHLYAIGETTHTGLHGANRMASNSLLECLVFANATSHEINADNRPEAFDWNIPPWDESRVTEPDEEIVVAHNWDELRRFMWDYVGIVRTTKRLQRAKRRVDLLISEIDEYYSNFRVNGDLIELRNITLVADIIIKSALSRKESRGLHYTLDYPGTNPELEHIDTVLDPNTEASAQKQRAWLPETNPQTVLFRR